ncbi:hypothetical protein BDN70DRAFT_820442, partial [Pholiota conissans]
MHNQVKIVDAEYFKYNFKAKRKEANMIRDDIIKEFHLNKDQTRAFKIIANHAACVKPPQLKMYLGGMGGTGKSQVIRALIEMFHRKKESHRFIVLAPTGTAAALLNGSTYHSALGIRINDSKEGGIHGNKADTIYELKSKLSGVDYIFIDEVSMIACHELYSISARL